MSQIARVSRRTFSAAAENLFKARDQEAKHAAGLIGTWRNISLFVMFPSIALAGYHAWANAHVVPDEFKQYPWLRKRAKKFPWGDGNHTLFHNAHLNPLPSGFEHESHH